MSNDVIESFGSLQMRVNELTDSLGRAIARITCLEEQVLFQHTETPPPSIILDTTRETLVELMTRIESSAVAGHDLGSTLVKARKILQETA